MKQIFTLLALVCLVAGSLNAQHNRRGSRFNDDTTHLRIGNVERMALAASMAKNTYDYKLDGYMSDDQYEIFRYTYQNNRIVSIYDLYVGEWETIDSLRYDSQGHLTKYICNQFLPDGSGWAKVYYIDYTYDNEGRVLTRKNYNRDYEDHSQYNLGGTYNYHYENGKLDRVLITLGLQEIIFQSVDYIYDNAGNLIREIWSIDESFDGTGSLLPNEILHYRYENGRCVETFDSVWDPYNYDWYLAGRDTYVYDENGNCLEAHSWTRSGNESTRSEYVLNNYRVNQTLLPTNPERTLPKFYENTFCYDLERWYQMDDNNTFSYAWDYIYSYSGINGIQGIEKMDLKVYPNPATNYIVLDGEEELPFFLYDQAGRLVLNGFTKDHRIDVSHLAKGSYTLVSNHKGAHVVIAR